MRKTAIVFIVGLAALASYAVITRFEASDLRDKLSAEVQERKELEAKRKELETKITKYFAAQGRRCPSETEKCLDEAITSLTALTESGQPDCSPVRDNICSPWCAAGSDYDCCLAKGPEWRWYQGRGCYSSKE